MEVYMELSKKTTILFSPELHDRLRRLAVQKGISMGELIRSACEKVYGIFSREEKIRAVKDLADLDLPVDEIPKMKEESMPRPEELIR